MAVVSLVLFFFDINYGQGHGSDMAVFDIDRGPFRLVPVVHGAVGITDNGLTGVVGHAAVGPVMDAIAGGEVIRFACGPGVDHDVVKAAGIPDARVFEVWDPLGKNRVALRLVRPEDAFITEKDSAVAGDELEVAIGACHDRDVGGVPPWFAFDRNGAEVLPRAVERFGDIDLAGAGFADDNGVAAVGQGEGGDIVPPAAGVVWPAEALVHVGPKEGIGNSVDSNRAEPAAVAPGFIPTAGEHVVLAVGGFDDLAVPVAVFLDGGVFQAVLDVAREDVGRAPGVTKQLALRRSGEEIADERPRLGCGRVSDAAAAGNLRSTTW